MSEKSIMTYETVELDEKEGALVILDQTLLPGEVKILHLKDQKDIWQAIYLLQVRGAPAIGVAAAFGVYLAAKEIQAETWEEFYQAFHEAKEYLNSARPTAVNLSWAVRRMLAPPGATSRISSRVKERVSSPETSSLWAMPSALPSQSPWGSSSARARMPSEQGE